MKVIFRSLAIYWVAKEWEMEMVLSEEVVGMDTVLQGLFAGLIKLECWLDYECGGKEANVTDIGSSDARLN